VLSAEVIIDNTDEEEDDEDMFVAPANTITAVPGSTISAPK
jgi:hypothetical protein